MATHVSSPTLTRHIVHVRPLRISNVLTAVNIPMPRTRTVVTTALIVGGLSLPILMVFGIIPANFLLAAAGLGMTALGGVCALIFCGEL